MTKLRAPGSVEDGVLQAIAILGDEGAARATGKSATMARQWSAPDNERQIQMRDAVKLDAACELAGYAALLLRAYRSDLARQVAAGGGRLHRAGDPLERVADLLAEAGDVARAVREAAKDGRYDMQELARIAKEGREVVDAVEALMLDLRNTKGG